MLKNYYVDVWASFRQLRSLSLPAYNSGYAVRFGSPKPLRASHTRRTLSEIRLGRRATRLEYIKTLKTDGLMKHENTSHRRYTS